MSKVIKVNYAEMATQAKKIRENGKQLNNQIIKIHTYLTDLHEYWYGKRYNELIKAFNKMVPQLNEILSFVEYRLPYALELIANNYSMVDIKQKETLENDEEPNRIKEIRITNDVGMRFISEQVINIQQEISRCFEIAKEQMNEIEIEYKKITWESEAADIFERNFRKIKDEIMAFFEHVNVSFKELIKQAESDFVRVEKTNNIG